MFGRYTTGPSVRKFTILTRGRQGELRNKPCVCGLVQKQWRGRDLNPRHEAYESPALPSELPRPIQAAEYYYAMHLLSTSSFQSLFRSNLLTPPDCSGKMSPYGKQVDIDDERTAQIEDGERLRSRENTSTKSGRTAWHHEAAVPTAGGRLPPERDCSPGTREPWQSPC